MDADDELRKFLEGLSGSNELAVYNPPVPADNEEIKKIKFQNEELKTEICKKNRELEEYESRLTEVLKEKLEWKKEVSFLKNSINALKEAAEKCATEKTEFEFKYISKSIECAQYIAKSEECEKELLTIKEELKEEKNLLKATKKELNCKSRLLTELQMFKEDRKKIRPALLRIKNTLPKKGSHTKYFQDLEKLLKIDSCIDTNSDDNSCATVIKEKKVSKNAQKGVEGIERPHHQMEALEAATALSDFFGKKSLSNEVVTDDEFEKITNLRKKAEIFIGEPLSPLPLSPPPK